MIKDPFCVPRFRGASGRSNRKSLLDRLREAVFRLIMLSAFCDSKGATKLYSHDNRRSTDSCYYPKNNDPQHSEAVADCIEFIKRSATGNRNSTASHYSGDSSAPQVVVPLPIM